MREFLLNLRPRRQQPRSNAIALVIGLALFLLVVALRSSVDSKFDVSATDLVLAFVADRVVASRIGADIIAEIWRATTYFRYPESFG